MQTDDLIRFKTDAWKAPDMAAWYAQRMDENAGTNRLKNLVETTLFERHSAGDDILDVGVGTGRASIPLARAGRRVTGIDSSAAMLDQCRRLAGATPMTLIEGDVTDLPVPDASFDTAMALNVLTHFPHWQQILASWKRVLRPEGRMIFDIYSLDHLEWLRGRRVELDELAANGAESFNMHIRVEDLVGFANENGLSVEAVVPYGSLFSGEPAYRHASPLPLPKLAFWRRRLAWLQVDDALLDFTAFLDLQLFGRLTSEFTGRFVAVLSQRPDPKGNEEWLAAYRQRSAATRKNLTLESLGMESTEGTAWRDQFARHLAAGPRQRSLAFMLLRALWPEAHSVDWRSLAGEQWGAWFQDMELKEQTDRQVFDFCRSWHQAGPLSTSLQHRGVDLGASLEYALSRRLLKDFFQDFFQTP